MTVAGPAVATGCSRPASRRRSYFLPEDVDLRAVRPSAHRTWCEWKGRRPLPRRRGRRPVTSPRRRGPTTSSTPAFAAIAGHLAFYAQKADECFVDGERVQANEGGFYGGWITSKVVGPFKGGPGTLGW